MRRNFSTLDIVFSNMEERTLKDTINTTINPIEYKYTADGFRDIGTRAAMIADGYLFLRYYVGPCAVNLSFSCELYMKAMINDVNLHEHSLKKLFNKLDDNRQRDVRIEYDKIPCNLEFMECFETHDNAFIKWRYLGEYRDKETKSIDRKSLVNLARALSIVCEREIQNGKDK